MASFGATISSGIQDISAILSLFGTEQCELHIGSALRGGGGGGYLYAAITPVSIFGSLGAAKAAFTIMLLGLPFGARTLKHIGFEPKGDVVAATMLEKQSDHYLTETRLLHLLDKHYIRSAQHVCVKRPDVTARFIPLRPWDLRLLVVSLFVACLGVIPYVHFTVLHHSSFPALAIFFPFCRVFGGLLCVFPGQLLLQYRIEMITKQRLLFKGINDTLHEQNTKIPVQHLLWDDTFTSETCLSSLVDFLKSNEANNSTLFVKHVAHALRLPSEPSSREVAKGIKTYLTNTWSWLALLCALLLGFFMTIIGYIGCFTIVQSSSASSDTYIWLGLETALAFFRLLIWALNPSWDDSDGISLAPTEFSPLPGVMPTWVVIERKSFQMFKIISETGFWQALTAYSGPVDIGNAYVRGSQRWYSWIKGEEGEMHLVCIIVEGQETVLCRLDERQDMKFYHADIKFNSGHVVQKEELEKDHELMKEETNFKLDVFEHYNFIISTKNRARDSVGSITASWPLSESSVTRLVVNNTIGPRAQDPEHGNQTGDRGWSQLVIFVEMLLSGKEPGYKEFSICRGIIPDAATSKGLRLLLWDYLSTHTTIISSDAPWNGGKLKNYYNDKWEIYSKAILYLDRLFEPLTVNRGKGTRVVDIDTVLNMAVINWESTVLEILKYRLGGIGLNDELNRVLPLFLSGDWTRADFWNMKLRREEDPSVLEEASAHGRTGIVRLLLEVDSANGAHQPDRALQAASSSGHIAIVRLLLEKGANLNNAPGGPALQTASGSGQTEVVRVLLASGADVNASGGKYGSALQAASYEGHEEIARLLLDAGANVNMLGGLYHGIAQAASTGREAIVRLLLEAGADVNGSGGKYGSALQAASHSGHTTLVRLLLEKGADVNKVGGKYGTALQDASCKGHEEIASLLLQNGADVNAFAGEFGSALQAAASSGHTAVVHLLLGKGADVNMMGGKYGTSLQAACYEGHRKVVQLLLEAGAAFVGEFGSALQAASRSGHTAVVRLLLEKGADIKMVEGKYGTALHAASYEGHEEVVRLLIENGADVNAFAGEFGSALQAATSSGHSAVVRLLLGKDADVNMVGGKYGTALQAASCKGHKEIARLLLENGADMNASHGNHGSALQAASSFGHTAVVRLLLENGAEINMAGGEYATALHAASYEGHEDVVRLLVEAGATVNASHGNHGSALQAASSFGHTAVVRLLLEKGAEINMAGGEYGNALQAACRLLGKGADMKAGGEDGSALQTASKQHDGNLEVARLLLEKGADANMTGGEWGSPLHLASKQGNIEIARLLLEKGANVNLLAGEWGSPLHLASIFGQRQIARFLLEKGADVNMSSGDGVSPLHLASMFGQVEITRLLLEKGAQVSVSEQYGTALEIAHLTDHAEVAPLLRMKMGAQRRDEILKKRLGTGF
ncbi:ankyrin repeat-containing domain protein [Mycena epipterygia]|nr:ankyrin repeat-containing domain protein [Mycena epipterygia]